MSSVWKGFASYETFLWSFKESFYVRGKQSDFVARKVVIICIAVCGNVMLTSRIAVAITRPRFSCWLK